MLTSCIMRILKRLVLSQLWPLMMPDPLQFAYKVKVGMDDAIIYVLPQALLHLDGLHSMVNVLCLLQCIRLYQIMCLLKCRLMCRLPSGALAPWLARWTGTIYQNSDKGLTLLDNWIHISIHPVQGHLRLRFPLALIPAPPGDPETFPKRSVKQFLGLPFVTLNAKKEPSNLADEPADAILSLRVWPLRRIWA